MFEEIQTAGGFVGEVNDAAVREGTVIGDGDADGSAVADVGDAKAGAAGKATVGGGEFGGGIDAAAGGFVAFERRAVEGGIAALGFGRVAGRLLRREGCGSDEGGCEQRAPAVVQDSGEGHEGGIYHRGEEKSSFLAAG